MMAMLLVDTDETFVGTLLGDDTCWLDMTAARLAEHITPALRYQAARPDAGPVFVCLPEEI